jgi:hypothetical protein
MNDMVRLKILNDMLSSMSDEDRRTYAILSSQKDDHGMMQQEIRSHGEKLDELIQRTSWTKTFLSDVGANVITNAAFLLVAKLFK